MIRSVLKKYIEEYNIRDSDFCIYTLTHQIFMFKTTNIIVQLKKLLEKV